MKKGYKNLQNADLIIQAYVTDDNLQCVAAFKYDITKDSVPIVIFKRYGKKIVMKIKKIAQKNGILFIERDTLYLSYLLANIMDSKAVVPHPLDIDETHYPHLALAFAYIHKMRHCHIKEDLFVLSEMFADAFEETVMGNRKASWNGGVIS